MDTDRAFRGAHLRPLLGLLLEPSRVQALPLAQWEMVVRTGRSSQLLAVLLARLERHGLMAFVPARVHAHMISEDAVARFRRQMANLEMRRVARVLDPIATRLVLLKGGAYLIQGLACAEGRLLSDVDIMLPRQRLAEAERTLLEAGWLAEPLEPYDERYYRVWGHELPPLRYPGHPMELDVHHTILPVRGRIRLDADALFAAALPVPGSTFWVLSHADQVLHASAHLFQDSDCSDRLRDLIDLDGLIRELSSAVGFWDQLVERSFQLGLQRPLWYALRYCSGFLRTPVPGEVQPAFRRAAPIAPIRFCMDGLVRVSLPPADPDRDAGTIVSTARSILLIRSVWLRMPPWIVLWHALVKAWRAVRAASTPAVDAG